MHDGVDRDDLIDIADPFTTPADPDRGLPRLCRSRSRLSSEFSEDGAEGGSRRGSVSESSITIRVPTMEVASTGEAEGQNRPITPVEGEAIQKPQLPLSSSLTSSVMPLTKPVDVSLATTCASISPLSTESVQYKGDRRVSEPIIRPAVLPVSSDQGECTQLPLTAVRPPPLRLMSMGSSDALPLVSPVLSSPGSASHGTVARRTSLPLLSPLCTTPTPPHVFPMTKVTMATTPQLVPTTLPTQHVPPPPSPNSAHPPSLGLGHTGSTASSQPWPPVDTDIHRESTSQLIGQEVTLTQAVPESSHDRPHMSHDQAELSRGQPESSHDQPESSKELTSAPRDTEVGERVGKQLDVPPSISSPPSFQASLSESKDHSSEEEQSPPHKYPPLSPPHHPPKSPLPHSETTPPEERDRDSDQDVQSSGESRASSIPPPSPDSEPARKTGLELERKTGFDVMTTPADAEKQATQHESPPGERMRVLEVGRDIDMEGGGEGGVAFILHGEEEMELPGIEQQLQLSESDEDDEEDSSSSSGSEDDVEPPLPEVSQSIGSEGFVDLGPKRIFVQPPHSTFVRSSSHSLASTPSVSPSPSPIPQPSPLPTSQHSMPTLSSVPVPEHKPSPSKTQAREEAKSKAVFSTAPLETTTTKSQTGPLIVSFRKHLVASLSKGTKEEVKRTSTKQQRMPSSLPSSHQPTPKPGKSPGAKLKKRRVGAPSVQAPPDIVIEPPPSSPLVVCISRSQLHHKMFGLTSALSQTTLTFSDEEDDDMIITHSSAEQVKFKPPMERTKPDIGSERVKSAMERIVVPSQPRYSHSSPTSEQCSVSEMGGGAGLWKRELDISEMGLLSSAPHAAVEEQPVCVLSCVCREGGGGRGERESVWMYDNTCTVGCLNLNA